MDYYYGNHRNISSMSFCIESNQIGVIIQKMSFLRPFIAHMEKPNRLEYNMYLLELHDKFMTEVLDGFDTKVQTTVYI